MQSEATRAVRSAQAGVKRAVAHGRAGRTDAGQIDIWLVCGVCQRRLRKVRTLPDGGYQDQGGPATEYEELAGATSENADMRERLLGTASERIRIVCRCGADHPVVRERLTTAVEKAATEKEKRQRRVVLPIDLR